MANVKTIDDVGAQTMARRKQTTLNNKKRTAANSRLNSGAKQKTTGGMTARDAYKARALAKSAVESAAKPFGLKGTVKVAKNLAKKGR